jgi:hypothetical protein
VAGTTFKERMIGRQEAFDSAFFISGQRLEMKNAFLKK